MRNRRHRLEPISTEEGARDLLKNMVKSGKITLEDLDQESRHSAFNREIVEKHYPEIKLKPHRNLLRDPEPIEAVQASADPRDFDPGPVSNVRPDISQVLRSEEEEVLPQVSLTDSQQVELSESLPF
jgi:hypothetical protein